MYTFKSMLIIASISVVLSSITFRRAGWLDRVVQYHKNRFVDDLLKQSNLKFTARIEKAPPGYVDSKDWDYESVVRLLTLIRDSEGAEPVRRAFRQAIKTRRFVGYAESFKLFPSLAKDHPNNFYYPVDSGEYYADLSVKGQAINPMLDMTNLVVVSNPVEAKLPSGRISIALLKSIMENRAAAGRVMPTTDLTISWPETSKRTTVATSATDKAIVTTASMSTTASEGAVTTETAPGNVTAPSGNGTSANTTATNQTAAI